MVHSQRKRDEDKFYDITSENDVIAIYAVTVFFSFNAYQRQWYQEP